MILPTKIKSKYNKIRDAAICIEWEKLLEDKDYPTIESMKKALSIKFKLTELRIYQIVRENHAYIPLDKEWEKKKRINRYKLEIKKKKKSKKDVADLMEQLRMEIEGNKVNLEHSGEVKFTVTEKISSARERVLSAIQNN